VFGSRLNGGRYGTERTKASVLLARGALKIPEKKYLNLRITKMLIVNKPFVI
jgi:hypothetical protein